VLTRLSSRTVVILLAFLDSVIVYAAPRPWPLVSWVVTLVVLVWLVVQRGLLNQEMSAWLDSHFKS
jgi:hypothetical protein